MFTEHKTEIFHARKLSVILFFFCSKYFCREISEELLKIYVEKLTNIGRNGRIFNL